jgi:hypothetical protein
MKKIAPSVSRRRFLRASSMFVVAVPAAVVAPCARANKADKSDVSYRDKPGANGKRCGGCASFVAPRACRVVDGDVSPDGWCIAYSER